MFKVIIVDSIAGASELEKQLNAGLKLVQATAFDSGVVFILIDESSPKFKLQKPLTT